MKYYNVKELAELAGLTAAYIRELLKEKQITGMKRGSRLGGFWEIEEAEAVRWLAGRGVHIEEK